VSRKVYNVKATLQESKGTRSRVLRMEGKLWEHAFEHGFEIWSSEHSHTRP